MGSPSESVLLDDVFHVRFQLEAGVVRYFPLGQHLWNHQLRHTIVIAAQCYFLLLKIYRHQRISFCQPGFCNRVAIITWIPPVLILAGGGSQWQSINFLNLRKGECDGRCRAFGEILLESIVFPARCDVFLHTNPLGSSALNLLKGEADIKRLYEFKVLHHPNLFKFICLADLMDIGGIPNGWGPA